MNKKIQRIETLLVILYENPEHPLPYQVRNASILLKIIKKTKSSLNKKIHQ